MGSANGFKECRERFSRIKNTLMRQVFISSAYELMKDAVKSNEAILTGNTLTSFVIGLYENGRLYKIIDAYDIPNIQPPTRKKITKGEGRRGVLVLTRYKSYQKSIVRTDEFVKTSDEYGEDTARRFLLSFKNGMKGFSMVMATGTEYSEYLESAIKLNVLQETYDYTESIFKRHLKNIKL